MARTFEPENALDLLAKTLHDKMEHLDPSLDGDWGALPERKRDFYRLCIRAVISERRLVDHLTRNLDDDWKNERNS